MTRMLFSIKGVSVMEQLGKLRTPVIGKHDENAGADYYCGVMNKKRLSGNYLRPPLSAQPSQFPTNNSE